MARNANRLLAVAAAAGITLVTGGISQGLVSAPSRVHAEARIATGVVRHANTGVTLHNAAGIKVQKVQRVGGRQIQATIKPNAIGRSLGVRIILPVGYRVDSERSYPTLYLFPGTSGHSTDWSTAGDAPKTTRPYPLITVTSDIGFNGDGGSWFSNWVNRNTSFGKAQWETYNIHELIPWIDANLKTIRLRSERAVAGLSQGGYGATEMAARHPDLFTEMGSFSGAPEIDKDPVVRVGATAIIDATMVGLNGGVSPDAPFGSHVTDEINWQGHDPAYTINNLKGIGLWFATADGAPGKYDDPVTNPTGVVTGGAIESLTHVSTDTFIGHLKQAKIPYQVYDYGSGTHSWPYWARDFRKFIPTLMHRFAHPPAKPKAIHYTSIDQHWKEFGWKVFFNRSANLAWGTLHHANAHGFRIQSASAVDAIVSTPHLYKPNQTCRVRIGSAKPKVIGADRFGHLHIDVPLKSASARGVRVRIKRLPVPHHAPID